VVLEEESIGVQQRGVDGVGVDGGGAVGLLLASVPTGSVCLLGFVGHSELDECWFPCPPIYIMLYEGGPLS
jgi:hypothetical protein